MNTLFYINMFNDDYLVTVPNRVTGKDEILYFNTYEEAENYALKEGLNEYNFDIYETDAEESEAA